VWCKAFQPTLSLTQSSKQNLVRICKRGEIGFGFIGDNVLLGSFHRSKAQVLESRVATSSACGVGMGQVQCRHGRRRWVVAWPARLGHLGLSRDSVELGKIRYGVGCGWLGLLGHGGRPSWATAGEKGGGNWLGQWWDLAQTAPGEREFLFYFVSFINCKFI
jgi:hypothetical protein